MMDSQIEDTEEMELSKEDKVEEINTKPEDPKSNPEISLMMQDLKRDVLNRVELVMNNVIADTEKKVNFSNLNGTAKEIHESYIYSNRMESTTDDSLPTKKFLERDSLLTEMYKNKHIRTIYNLCVSTLIILMIHTAVSDIRRTGSPNLGIDTVRAGFAKFSIVLYVWSLMKVSTLVFYAGFAFWATYSKICSPKSIGKKFFDYSWLSIFIIYEIHLFYLPTRAVLQNQMPLASSMVILMEQIRLVMKTYAFLRSVAPRFLSYKPHTETAEPEVPGFSKYLYFMFAPTLIYQDIYPRSKNIRWNIVLMNFAEVATIIFFVALLYERMLYPNFKDFGKEPVELETLILNILSSMLPGILMYLCGFYLLLHSWMNAFAELLRFADKMFYKDWWNSNGYSSYYRTWNIVVHDWLYTYIYKDMYEIVTSKNRVVSTCAVFAISAIMHEYIICCSIRFFYPVMLVLFGGVGLSAVFVLKSAGNKFIWLTLSAGSGMMVSLYCMEYFARIYCSSNRDDFLGYIMPRTLTCIYK